MGQQVTEMLVRMGQQGQIRGKVTDEALKGLLEQVSRNAARSRDHLTVRFHDRLRLNLLLHRLLLPVLERNLSVEASQWVYLELCLSRPR